MRRRIWLTWMLAACATAVWADVDPPARVARLNLVSGAVSFEAAGLSRRRALGAETAEQCSLV